MATPILITRSYVTATAVQCEAILEYALITIAGKHLHEKVINRTEAMQFVHNRQLVRVVENKHGAIYDTPKQDFKNYCIDNNIRYR